MIHTNSYWNWQSPHWALYSRAPIEYPDGNESDFDSWFDVSDFFVFIETRYRFCEAVCLWRKQCKGRGGVKTFNQVSRRPVGWLPILLGPGRDPKIFLFYLYWRKLFIMVKSWMSILCFSGKSNNCTLPIFLNLENCTIANLQVARAPSETLRTFYKNLLTAVLVYWDRRKRIGVDFLIPMRRNNSIK